MGTSTIFKRHNDLSNKLANMTKEELERIDKLSPWSKERESTGGWSVSVELHNGNFYPLIWWYGQLIHLRDAPSLLAKKHYNRYTGKYSQASEWTLLKKYLEMELKELDKEYKRFMAKQHRSTKQ